MSQGRSSRAFGGTGQRQESGEAVTTPQNWGRPYSTLGSAVHQSPSYMPCMRHPGWSCSLDAAVEDVKCGPCGRERERTYSLIEFP